MTIVMTRSQQSYKKADRNESTHNNHCFPTLKPRRAQGCGGTATCSPSSHSVWLQRVWYPAARGKLHYRNSKWPNLNNGKQHRKTHICDGHSYHRQSTVRQQTGLLDLRRPAFLKEDSLPRNQYKPGTVALKSRNEELSADNKQLRLFIGLRIGIIKFPEGRRAQLYVRSHGRNG